LQLNTAQKCQVFGEISSPHIQDRINALIIQSEVSILKMEMHGVARQLLCLKLCIKLYAVSNKPNIYTHINFHMHFSSPLDYYMPSSVILYLPKRTAI
jgi:hypothetical protein